MQSNNLPKLRSFGCSFTFGSDLHDCESANNLRASHSTWPALIAKNHGRDYATCARGGVGNLWILQAIMRWISLRKRPEHFCWIVNWTYIDRFDIWQDHREWVTIRPTTSTDVARTYYRDLDTQQTNQLRTLTYMYAAINVLQQHKIPFMMTCIDDLVFLPCTEQGGSISLLQELVRPHVHDFEGKNFLSWSRFKGYPISVLDHPLEQAHEAAAQLMSPIIDAILHKA